MLRVLNVLILSLSHHFWLCCDLHGVPVLHPTPGLGRAVLLRETGRVEVAFELWDRNVNPSGVTVSSLVGEGVDAGPCGWGGGGGLQAWTHCWSLPCFYPGKGSKELHQGRKRGHRRGAQSFKFDRVGGAQFSPHSFRGTGET